MYEALIAFPILLIVSAFFSAAEIAIFSLGSGKIRTMVNERLFLARLVAWLAARPRKTLMTVLIGNQLTNVCIAVLATHIALQFFDEWSLGIATGAATIGIVILGSLIPKSFAQYHARGMSRIAAPFVVIVYYALWPVTWLLEKGMDLISLREPHETVTREAKNAVEEITALFDIGYEEGTIEPYERDLAERLFRLREKTTEALMKPFARAAMLKGDLAIKDAVHAAAATGYSRLVVGESAERIHGIVHVKDIMEADKSEKRDGPVSSLAQEPFTAFTTDLCGHTLSRMLKAHAHFALVKEDDGAVVGFVTLEDLLEELHGEIYDETDDRRGAVE